MTNTGSSLILQFLALAAGSMGLGMIVGGLSLIL